ncbi:TRAP transporter small permease subunit [Thioclava sp. JE_KL1]|uniref:TRAP transporter small permease subunit n=1 Tax=Thioclava sp. JE_KL1 TaxID=2651187 RepID=UPI00128DEAA3|nr:TRAP transporter small permease [Thioclava sp. JE_KL1]MPQ92545.1 TRAP transporter small permease [Thioclava sp. JE_KL1]
MSQPENNGVDHPAHDPHTPEPVQNEDEAATIPEAGILGRAINAVGIVFALGIIASALILLNEVVLRYGFDSPTIWAHETTIFLCAMAFVYGGLYCVVRNSHIRVVLIYDMVTGRAKRILDAIISLICLFAAGFFAWAAYGMVMKATFRPGGDVHFETSGSAWDPPFPAYLKIFLLVVLCLMVVQFIIMAVNYLRGAFASEAGK